MGFQGRTALVSDAGSGSGSGIGAAIREARGRAIACACDVSKQADVDAAFAKPVAEFGGVNARADFRTLGHAALFLCDRAAGDAGPSVVVDPWRGHGDGVRAGVALVTHGHPDHCSEEDLLAATADAATILCPSALAPRLENAFPRRVVPLDAGGAWSLPGISVRALPAEGPPRAAGFHPRGDGLSYLVELGGARFLVLGDSTALADHEGLAPDVAFFAVGDFTVMTPEEAADAAARVRPRLAVPVHWGDTSARFAAALRFVSLCEGRGIPSVPLRTAGQSPGGSDPDRAPEPEEPCSSMPSPTAM